MDDTEATAGEPAADSRRRIEAQVSDWENNELAAFLAMRPETQDQYFSGSRAPVKRVYTPADIADVPFEDIGLPGQYPFTRGPYPTMYRGRVWTMRQIAGFGTPAETNQRFRYLIEQGQTGLSVDFDMPTLMGYDSDDAMSLGEVGREGVAVDVLEDMEKLFEDINLEDISVSMTINPSGWILLAMYIAVAQRRGYDLNKLSGTIQNDILKEYIAQKEWIYPPEPSMRIVRDTITYTATRMARYNPVNISGYHTSEAGSSAVQEIAFTIAAAREYIRTVVATGMNVDTFAPRLSFFFVCQADFFEEIAKFRAARRYYARMLKEEFGAANPESMRMRFHTQTAAATLTKPQPYNNIVRTAIQALAAVLGGTQSLHTNAYDEAIALPTERAARLALRTQQVLAHETDLTATVDPFAGSYAMESMTDDVEAAAAELMAVIENQGGAVAAIERGFQKGEIERSAYRVARQIDAGDRVVVGVNKFISAGDAPYQPLRVDPAIEEQQAERLALLRASRDGAEWRRRLTDLTRAAAGSDNVLVPLREALRARATVGEACDALREVWGTYRPPDIS